MQANFLFPVLIHPVSCLLRKYYLYLTVRSYSECEVLDIVPRIHRPIIGN